MAKCVDSLMEVLNWTLLTVQKGFASVMESVEEAVNKLIEQEMIERDDKVRL